MTGTRTSVHSRSADTAHTPRHSSFVAKPPKASPFKIRLRIPSQRLEALSANADCFLHFGEFLWVGTTSAQCIGAYWIREWKVRDEKRVRVLQWWTRTQRIRTEAELPFAAILTDTTAAPRYQRIAAKALDLHELGLESTTIARKLNTTDKTVIKALAWLARFRQGE